MKSKIVGFCRYSVLTNNGNAWLVGRNQSWEDYKATVLDPKRLATRLRLLERVLLPSLAGQTLQPGCDWFRFYLLASDQLPDKAYADLLEVVNEYPWCQVVLVSADNGAFSRSVNNALVDFVGDDELFITFRVDDDDALGRKYLEYLDQFSHSRYRGYVITFPRGYKAWFDESSGAYSQAAEHWQPKIALGLAYVGYQEDKVKHIHQTGGHNKVDRLFPVVSIPSEPMYIRTYHLNNDVLSVEQADERLSWVENKLSSSDSIELAELDRHFTLALSSG
ncbi:glycosyltransferase [Cobetia marina]